MPNDEPLFTRLTNWPVTHAFETGVIVVLVVVFLLGAVLGGLL